MPGPWVPRCCPRKFGRGKPLPYARPTSEWEEYCQEHGLEYTTVNPPKELTEAVDQAMEELIEAQAGEIQYYLNE